ncbi:hypothetical protein A3Q32_09125 [Alcanivorax sp. KX64203]|nr:hypothetical protein A3Q32_09125 [Alcanivorax sp. KX64203]
MYTNPGLKWVLLPLLIIGLLPLAYIYHDPVRLIAYLCRAVAAVLAVLFVLKITDELDEPIWLAVAGSLGIFLAGSIFAGLFGVLWFVALFAVGWLLTHWLFELTTPIVGAYVGIALVFARYLGGLLSMFFV